MNDLYFQEQFFSGCRKLLKGQIEHNVKTTH